MHVELKKVYKSFLQLLIGIIEAVRTIIAILHFPETKLSETCSIHKPIVLTKIIHTTKKDKQGLPENRALQMEWKEK